jgi:hypothetical protein
MSKELIQQALDALQDPALGYPGNRRLTAVHALTAALALPDAQPVASVQAWRDVAAEAYEHWDNDREMKVGKILRAMADPDFAKSYGKKYAALHATPQPAIALESAKLTTDDIWGLWESENGLEDCDLARCRDFEKVVRAIEAAIHAKQAAK